MKRARLDSLHASPSRELPHHQPKISRKIRACQACQNRKIKCNLEPGREQCARCSRLGLKCIVNKSLQTLLDGENEWKRNIEVQLQSLQAALAEIQRAPSTSRSPSAQLSGTEQNIVESLDSASFEPFPPSRPNFRGDAGVTVPPRPAAMTRENSVEADAALEGEDEGEGDEQAMVKAPMASLFELTKLRNVRSDPWARGRTHRLAGGDARKPDFISQGKLELRDAERLFTTFQETLNAYLWGGIALVHDTLDEVRASSPLLTAAILAATALHARDEGRTFDICYPIFLDLVSQAMFDRYHALDDVRGLCIAAFYLSDLSWKLSGLAVRIATELNLHQFCALALTDGGRPEYVEEARLWYLLYVCDHHFSIAYGRPSIISEDATLSCHEDFLGLPGIRITMADQRLHSQVGVFVIMSRIHHAFGSDRSRMIGDDEFELLRRFDGDLTRWRDQWKHRLAPNVHVADYPAKGLELHRHFARVQLFSVCLRGLRPAEQHRFSGERRELVNLAIGSAFGALELIRNDADLRQAVVGVPLYLLTTIAHACLFLMKAQTQWKPANLDICHESVTSTIEGIVMLLKEASPCVRHVAHYLGRGLDGMLERFREHDAEQGQKAAQDGQPVHVAYGDGEIWSDWNSWMFGSSDVACGPFALDQDQQYGLSFLDALSSQMPG